MHIHSTTESEFCLLWQTKCRNEVNIWYQKRKICVLFCWVSCARCKSVLCYIHLVFYKLSTMLMMWMKAIWSECKCQFTSPNMDGVTRNERERGRIIQFPKSHRDHIRSVSRAWLIIESTQHSFHTRIHVSLCDIGVWPGNCASRRQLSFNELASRWFILEDMWTHIVEQWLELLWDYEFHCWLICDIKIFEIKVTPTFSIINSQAGQSPNSAHHWLLHSLHLMIPTSDDIVFHTRNIAWDNWSVSNSVCLLEGLELLNNWINVNCDRVNCVLGGKLWADDSCRLIVLRIVRSLFLL